MQKGISRREFLGMSGAAAVAAGACLAGCAPQQAATGTTTQTAAAASDKPGFMTAPAQIADSEISETMSTDVLIIGAGIAGIAAARAATEAGAKVVIIEKGTTYGVRSSKYGPLNSSVHERLGQPKLKKSDVVNALQKCMGFRADTQLLNYWADHSGPDFDWWLEPVTYDLLMADTDTPPAGSKLWIKPTHWPHDPSYDWQDETSPCIIGELGFVSADKDKAGHIPVCEANAQKAIDAGAQFIFSTFGRQLIKENGRVSGAIVQKQTGEYMRIDASKGVILCCGDLSNDLEMRSYYVPWAADYQSRYNTMDCNGELADTGDGHKMGMWVGAKMEDGPLAAMTHNVGVPPAVGVDPFLLLNQAGERFMNEDVSGQDIENALSRQKGHTAWQIVDANWASELSAMPCGMANMTGVVPDDQYAGGGEKTSVGSFTGNATATANSLEELLDAIGVDKEKGLETIEHYNQLAASGVDDDFGKKSTRLFPLDTPPYYAFQFSQALILVVMGGLMVDHDSCQALDENLDPIPGLYVAGNTMGGRFLVDYPTVVQGISHSSCMTFGRLAGTSAAEAK